MTPSFWPTPQDYNEAIQNPAVCIADADLKDGVVDTNALGLPKSMTGAFASVYKVTCGDQAWAVRCFLSNRLEQQDRYKHISEFVLMDDLECTVDFYYIENGIKIRGEWFPVLKMPWVEGDTLDRYIFKNYKNTELMKTLLSDFHKMVADLKRAKIGHGDLQHGNVIVSADGLRLVDYDALFVPALAGKKSLEVGHPSYQHPERNANHYDKDVDNFSAWLIHSAIISIAIDQALYEKYCNGDDNLLFRRADLANPEKSELFAALLGHSSEHIRDAATLLKRMLWAAPNEIPILDAPAEELLRLPQFETEKRTREDNDSEQPEEIQPSVDDEDRTNSLQSSDFNFIDADAAMVRAATSKTATGGALRRLGHIVYFARKSCDDFHLWFSPMSFVARQMTIARLIFDKGDFESALKIYLRLYNVIEETKNTDVDDYSLCLFRLGCCYLASETPSLASNYFLLALQNAKAGSASRPALYLAMGRFETGDKAGALRLLTEHVKTDYELSHLLKAELPHHLFDRTNLFKFMISYSKHLLENENFDLAADGVHSAWLVLRLLDTTSTLDLSDENLESVLSLLALFKNNAKVNKTYLDIAHFCFEYEGPSRGSIAFLCSALRELTSTSQENSEALEQAIDAVALSDLKNEKDLSLMKTSALAAAPPELVRDTFVRLGEAFLKRESTDCAADIMRLACQITTDSDLSLSEELISVLEKLDIYAFLSLESIMENEKLFKYLIVYLGNSDHLELLATISLCLLKDDKMKQLAQLLTIVRYGAPDPILKKLCNKMHLPENSSDEIKSFLDQNINTLAEALNIVFEAVKTP